MPKWVNNLHHCLHVSLCAGSEVSNRTSITVRNKLGRWAHRRKTAKYDAMQDPGQATSILWPAETVALMAHPMNGQLACERDNSDINSRPRVCEMSSFAQDGASPCFTTSLNEKGEYDCFTNSARK